MAQKAPVASKKSKLTNNQKKAESQPKTPVKPSKAKCTSFCLKVTLQTKFVHSEDGNWREHWTAGPAVRAAKVELVEPGLATTSDGNGKATLDCGTLVSGGYTLKL